MTQKTLCAFGDSQTTGVTLANPNASFVHQVASTMGWGLSMQAVDGSFALDQADAIYSVAPDDTSNSVYVVGGNDVRIYDLTPANLAAYASCLLAECVWLATNNADVRAGNSPRITQGGIWGSHAVWTNQGVYSSQNGATLTIPWAGDTLVLGMAQQNGAGGVCQIETDGWDNGTFNTQPNSTITTYLGRSYGPRAVVIRGPGTGSHTTKITITSPGGGANIYLDWLWSNSVRSAPYPTLWMGGPTLCTTAGYSMNGGSAAATRAYNAVAYRVCQFLREMSLDARWLAPMDTIDPATDLNGADGIHWTLAGQNKMTAKMIAGAV